MREPMSRGTTVQERRYGSVRDFEADVGPMAAAHWIAVAQGEAKVMSAAGQVWGMIGALLTPFVLFGTAMDSSLTGPAMAVPAILFAVVCFGLAISTRRRQLVVTYRFHP
jgi:hypothetical protein